MSADPRAERGDAASDDVGADDVLDAWFGDGHGGRPDRPWSRRWFSGGRALDEALRRRFGATLEAAARGELDAWRATPEGNLALVVLLDQFPRNVHRGTARAFAHVERARELADAGIARGDLERLPFVQRVFLILPLGHHESAASQREALAHFRRQRTLAPPELADFARATLEAAEEHAAIVERFGRYPHRNDALGRVSTPEERAWLAAGARRFGQRVRDG